MGQTGLERLTAVFDAALASLRKHIPYGSVQAYAFALLCTCGATLFEVWLLWLDPKASPLSGYYPGAHGATGGDRSGRVGCDRRRLDRLVGIYGAGL
jgi:hypothetical protein